MTSLNASAVHVLQTLVVDGLGVRLKQIEDLFLKPGSIFSIFSLLSAMAIAIGYIVYRRRARKRRLGLRLIARALFPHWLLRSASTKADLGFLLLNMFVTGALIGWGLVSYDAVVQWTQAAMTHVFGRGGWIALDHRAAVLGLTVLLFLAYELAYWLDHYLSHVTPFLWAFHRVHHTAETLTPVTVFRVHPIDSLVFYNITALIMGATKGLALYLLGWAAGPATVFGQNVLFLTFVFLTVHLQHSHIWIAFTGRWGRIFASPAHHQIHHSDNPEHFGKNLGSCLALFDWMFGTLRVPSQAREPLVYGVESGDERPHSVTGGLITPFVMAFAGVGKAIASLAAAVQRRRTPTSLAALGDYGDAV